MIETILPREIIDLIFLYLPYPTLRRLCENGLSTLAAPILYKKVLYGHTSLDGFYRVSLHELDKLEAGTIKADIMVLSIGNDYDTYKLFNFFRTRQCFLMSIPSIHFHGHWEHYFDYALLLPLENIERLWLYEVYLPMADLVPSNLTSLFIETGSDQNALDLPKSLKELTMVSLVEDIFFDLQPYLDLLKIKSRIRRYNELSENLHTLKLSSRNTETLYFPGTLTHLDLGDCLIEDLGQLHHRLPTGLKVLKLDNNDITSLAGITFPDCLEILTLASCRLSTIEDASFPDLLKELNVRQNRLESLDKVRFPNLIALDISGSGIKGMPVIGSLSSVQLPRTLETLIVSSQAVKDWSATTLPESLMKLEIMVYEDPKTLRFPLYLESLHILFDSPKALHSNLILPSTLQKLWLIGGVPNTLDWDLPHLSFMAALYLSHGLISVPKSVVELRLSFIDSGLAKQLVLPPLLETLWISTQLDQYPDTLTDLTIYTDAYKEPIAIPPRIEYLRLYGESELRGNLIKLPDSLQLLEGCFDKLPERPSDWLKEYEVCNKNFGYGRREYLISRA